MQYYLSMNVKRYLTKNTVVQNDAKKYPLLSLSPKLLAEAELTNFISFLN